AAADTMGGTAATISGAVAVGQAGATGDGRTAYSFNGGHVALPGGFGDFSQGLTIEAWVKPTSAGNYARIVDLGNGQASDNIVFMRRGTTNTLSLEVLRGGA